MWKSIFLQNRLAKTLGVSLSSAAVTVVVTRAGNRGAHVTHAVVTHVLETEGH